MLRKLIRSIFKLGIYGIGLAAMYGAWDYTQKWEAAEGDLTLPQYVMSLNDQYGGAVTGLASQAVTLAQNGVASGAAMVAESGVMEKAGIAVPDQVLALSADPEAADPEAADAVSDLPLAEGAETGADVVVVASVERVMAPDVSLLPRSRPLK